MEAIYSGLTNRALGLLERAHESGQKRVIIAIAGPPGAGKTTSARVVCQGVNEKLGPGTAMVVPMDGFHLPRSVLAKMKDPDYAFSRRGAPFTFDAQGAVDLVKQLRSGKDVSAPGFDHAIKDPVADEIKIPSSVKLVIMEGNYVLLDDDIWRDISKLVDDKWLVKADWNVVRHRLANRHVRAGIAPTIEAGLERADENDIPNGKYLLQHSVKPDFEFESDDA